VAPTRCGPFTDTKLHPELEERDGWCLNDIRWSNSASLISFTIDSKQNLKVYTADQRIYYLQQNVAMLAQISQQISSIALQIAIPSSPHLTPISAHYRLTSA